MLMAVFGAVPTLPKPRKRAACPHRLRHHLVRSLQADEGSALIRFSGLDLMEEALSRRSAQSKGPASAGDHGNDRPYALALAVSLAKTPLTVASVSEDM